MAVDYCPCGAGILATGERKSPVERHLSGLRGREAAGRSFVLVLGRWSRGEGSETGRYVQSLGRMVGGERGAEIDAWGGLGVGERDLGTLGETDLRQWAAEIAERAGDVEVAVWWQDKRPPGSR